MTQTIINVPAAGAFDPTDITLTDDTSGAFLIKEGSNEYMRINTTNGSEAIILKGKPSNNAQLYINDQPFLQGDRNNLVQAASMGLALSVNSNGNRIENRIIHSTSHFAVQDGSSNKWLKIDNDSTATFTLDDGSAATFTITDNASPTPALHLRCTESALSNPLVEVNGLKVFSGKQLTLTSNTYGTAFSGSANQSRLSVSLGATSATRNVNIGAVNMDAFAQILTATPSTTSQTFTLDFNNTSTALSGLPISLYKLVLKNAGTESCTFTAASTMAGGGRVKGVDISGASIGVIDSSSGSITAAAGETIYVEVTNHVSDSAGGNSNRFIICKTICKI